VKVHALVEVDPIEHLEEHFLAEVVVEEGAEGGVVEACLVEGFVEACLVEGYCPFE
tara:strand:+ start:452 stop:619 length:168 start_codon:yes stop_codon:yes gene_type:complete